jgi:hypothetical protein
MYHNFSFLIICIRDYFDFQLIDSQINELLFCWIVGTTKTNYSGGGQIILQQKFSLFFAFDI